MKAVYKKVIRKGLAQIGSEGLERIIKSKRMLLDGLIYSRNEGCG